MSRSECGTPAAYRRHLRKDEPIDDACQEASRQDTARRREATRTESAALVAAALASTRQAVTADELADARANLAIVRAAMESAPASAIAALSKRRQELVAEIAVLTRTPAAIDPVDEISARRAQRHAWNASMSDTQSRRV